MRIAYIAHYQGPDFVKVRPSLHNLSLAGRVKIQLIAELLQSRGHEIEIISQGEVDRYEFRHYPAFDGERFHPSIPVRYLSALPVRFLTGAWEANAARNELARSHAARPFDLVIIYNMKRSQIACARYAVHTLGLPVVLEYEDDAFVNVAGVKATGFFACRHHQRCERTLAMMSGGMAVSPFLLGQLPPDAPQLLLRGIVNAGFIKFRQERSTKRNWAVFSGTHEHTQGLEQMITAWKSLRPAGWELHIAGQGPLTPKLQELARDDSSIVFRGYLTKEDNARLLCGAKIGMNAQDPTTTPGNVFALKIIEYLAADLHVVTTPRGTLEPELERGITYIQDNSTRTIETALSTLISSGGYEKTAREPALATYGPDAIARALDELVKKARDYART